MSYIRTRTILLFVVILHILPFRCPIFRGASSGRRRPYGVEARWSGWTGRAGRRAGGWWNKTDSSPGPSRHCCEGRMRARRTGRQSTPCTDAFVEDVNVTVSGYLRDESLHAVDFEGSFGIFLRLLGKAGLVERLDDTSIQVTLFIASDLSLNSSASDISGEFELAFRPRGADVDEKRVFGLLGRRFPRLFAEPQEAVGTLMRHQVIGSVLKQCELTKTTSWTTWAEQGVNISAYRLNSGVSETSSFIEPPQIALQFLPKRAINGMIHIVDRLIIPEFANFARASVSPSTVPRASDPTTSTRPTRAISQSPIPSIDDPIVGFSETPMASSSTSATAVVTGTAEATSERVCFPGSAEAHTAFGTVRMTSVVVGTRMIDTVNRGENGWTKVILFTHRESPRVHGRRVYPFVELRTKEFGIRLSGSHLLPVDGRLQQAARAHLGSYLETLNGSQEIISKRIVLDYGLYNPQTTSGFMVIDGIVVSCYTSVMNYSTAHALLAPLRAASRVELNIITKLLTRFSNLVETSIESMDSTTVSSSSTIPIGDFIAGIASRMMSIITESFSMKLSQTYVSFTKIWGIVVQQATSK